MADALPRTDGTPAVRTDRRSGARRTGADFRASLFIVGGVYVAQTVLKFTLPLLALELSGAGTGLALIKGAGFVPNILFAVVVGVLNDRMLKARAFRGYALTLAVTTALLFGAIASGAVSLPALALFVIVLNGVTYAIGNAQMGLIRLSVADDQLSDATAATATVRSVITTAGPAIAGFALLHLGHAGVAAACALVLALAAGASLFLRPDEVLPPPKPFRASLAEGWCVLRANRELVAMTIVIVLTNAAEGAFATALILKLKLVEGADAFEIGVVLAAAGVGAVIASRIAAPLRRRLGRRTAFFWPTLGLALL